MFEPCFRITGKTAKEGFLEIENSSTKSRSYRLADVYESLIAPGRNQL
jgi:hypothetical protein